MVAGGSFWRLTVDCRSWTQLLELHSTGEPGAAVSPGEADSTSKRKGRPGAAEVETTAEDIESSRVFQGTPRRERGGDLFSLFIRLRNCPRAEGICQGGEGKKGRREEGKETAEDPHRENHVGRGLAQSSPFSGYWSGLVKPAAIHPAAQTSPPSAATRSPIWERRPVQLKE
jgi:hypothetical protein